MIKSKPHVNHLLVQLHELYQKYPDNKMLQLCVQFVPENTSITTSDALVLIPLLESVPEAEELVEYLKILEP